MGGGEETTRLPTTVSSDFTKEAGVSLVMCFEEGKYSPGMASSGNGFLQGK